MTDHYVRDRTVYTPVAIPEGIDPQHPSVVGSIETHSRNIGGPTIGANLAIGLTRQLSIVPDVRYDYGSIGDETDNEFRTFGTGCSGGSRLTSYAFVAAPKSLYRGVRRERRSDMVFLCGLRRLAVRSFWTILSLRSFLVFYLLSPTK